jgi:hypothetical protein
MARARRGVLQILTEGGSADLGDPLIKAAALAVIANPYVGRPLTPELEELVAPSRAIGREPD